MSKTDVHGWMDVVHAPYAVSSDVAVHREMIRRHTSSKGENAMLVALKRRIPLFIPTSLYGCLIRRPSQRLLRSRTASPHQI